MNDGFNNSSWLCLDTAAQNNHCCCAIRSYHTHMDNWVMFGTMARACQDTALLAADEWRCLSDTEEEKRRKREGGGKVGRWEYLIAGFIVIDRERNASDKHIFDLLSVGKPTDRQQEALRPTIETYGLLSLWVT